MLRLKLQYFGHLVRRVDSLEKTLMLGGIGGLEGDDRRWVGWMASPTRWTWVWVNSRSLWWTGRPGMLRFMGLQGIRHDWVTEMNWTELILSMPWWGAWQPTPVFSPGETPWTQDLAGYSPWDHKELDTTKWLSTYLVCALIFGPSTYRDLGHK